jgi:hypothetical protein
MEEQTEREALPDPARRRFGRCGLGASGLLMTLACKPVLGNPFKGAPSSFLSANQSGHGEIGAGVWVHATDPAYWAGTTLWPIPPSTLFAYIFSTAPGSIYATLTLQEMVKGHADDTAELGKYLTAALLSARSGWTDFLPEATILAMFLEWRLHGYNAPTVGVQWSAADIVIYLKAVMVGVGGGYKRQY